MPSSRPRRSPDTTSPSNRNGPPRKRAALSTSPAATSPRMCVELTISPWTSTSGTTCVSNSGRDIRNSGSPLAFFPKRKFSPTDTRAALNRSTSTSWTNSSALFEAKSRSNGIVTSSSTPSPAMMSAFTLGGLSSFGAVPGAITDCGCGSNVSTVSLPRITSRWPRCTPSKVPIATLRPGFGRASGRGVIFMRLEEYGYTGACERRRPRTGRTTGRGIPVVRGRRRGSAKRACGLFEEVHRLLHPALHAGVDVRVAGFLGCVLDEDGHGRSPVHFGERQGVQRVVVGHGLVDLRRHEPLVGDDLAELAVEGDLVAAFGHHRVSPHAADPQIDLGDRHLAAPAAPPPLDQLRSRPPFLPQVLGRVEPPHDEDLLVGGERHRCRPATRHRHVLPPSS